MTALRVFASRTPACPTFWAPAGLTQTELKRRHLITWPAAWKDTPRIGSRAGWASRFTLRRVLLLTRTKTGVAPPERQPVSSPARPRN